LTNLRNPQSGAPAFLKSLIDRCFAAPALLIFLPVMAAIALCIRVTMGSPVLFRQLRPGRGGQVFMLCKFRTMRDARDASGRPLSDAERLTRLGRFLRSASLDELPQLWNVLCGDLSLVGPRPLLCDYLPLYTAEQRRRHDVMPGITGWTQVNGRNTLDWDKKFALDLWYVDHWSLMLDLRILAKTAACVLMRNGISYKGDATMPVFSGTKGSH
jgi:lipopolysaccharide/colanic/teichoic acid biosynthesis glycosyltransferase